MSGVVSYAHAASSAADQRPTSIEHQESPEHVSSSSSSSPPTESASAAVTAPEPIAAPEPEQLPPQKASSPTVLTPATVPPVNAWNVKQPSASTSLDTSCWPKPDDVVAKKDITGAAPKEPKPPAARSSGKEKWIPYTPVIQSSAQKSKKKTNSANGHNSQHNHNAANGSSQHFKQQQQQQHFKPGDKKSNGSAPQKANGSRPHHKQQNAQSTKSNKKKDVKDKADASSDKSRSPPNKERRFQENEFSTPNYPNNVDAYNKQQQSFQPSNGQYPPFNRRYQKNYYVQSDYLYNQQQMFAAAAAAASATPLPPSQYEITVGLVIAQIEYYLSFENLVKDFYLRRQMNSNGFIPLSILGNFNRIKSLTGGDINFLTEACRWAPSVELISDKLRPVNQWEQWVLPTSERSDVGRDDENPTSELLAAAQSLQETAYLATPVVAAPKFNAAAAVPFVPKGDSS